MVTDISRVSEPEDRIRYALKQANRAKVVSWSARELFFLVKIFFPAETQARVSMAAAALCVHGELTIFGRRYQTRTPAKAQTKSDTDPAAVRLRVTV